MHLAKKACVLARYTFCDGTTCVVPEDIQRQNKHKTTFISSYYTFSITRCSEKLASVYLKIQAWQVAGMADVLNMRGYYLTQIRAVIWAIKTNQGPLAAREGRGEAHLAIPGLGTYVHVIITYGSASLCEPSSEDLPCVWVEQCQVTEVPCEERVMGLRSQYVLIRTHPYSLNSQALKAISSVCLFTVCCAKCSIGNFWQA